MRIKKQAEPAKCRCKRGSNPAGRTIKHQAMNFTTIFIACFVSDRWESRSRLSLGEVPQTAGFESSPRYQIKSRGYGQAIALFFFCNRPVVKYWYTPCPMELWTCYREKFEMTLQGKGLPDTTMWYRSDFVGNCELFYIKKEQLGNGLHIFFVFFFLACSIHNSIYLIYR